ncbi:MAG: type VII secretion-associated serine protease mycosin [Actinomycetia bacterium]|nr:type VII secretion-associated serine protease mycosin [Actinomycetes bacterium]
MTRTASACVAAALAAVVWVCPPAYAVDQPKVDPAAPLPSGEPGPAQPMEQRGACETSGVIPGSDPAAATSSQAMLDLPAAWQFSRGDGQLVAVLDTGVQQGPLLPNVDPGGDYVGTTDGLTDCDGSGTLVAGIIAGQPVSPDGSEFSGVAPGAQLVSLRVTSSRFSPRTQGEDPALERASFDVATLARAIVHAADLGARVITIGSATCVPADRPVEQDALGAAIRYAAVDKDAVIVAAAGDSGQTGSGSAGTSCESNPLTDLGRPQDPRNWAGVTSVSVPSWWQPYILSVGSVTTAGQPSRFSMAGPWVGVAAPGEDISSVSNSDDGGLANGLPDNHQKMAPVSGTSYAAGYVSGVAALVRSKYPELNATQVVHRIIATAHNSARAPSNLVGAGIVDPLAALTWQLPADSHAAGTPQEATKPIALPTPPAPEDSTPRTVAFIGTAALILAVIVASLAARRRKDAT